MLPLLQNHPVFPLSLPSLRGMKIRNFGSKIYHPNQTHTNPKAFYLQRNHSQAPYNLITL